MTKYRWNKEELLKERAFLSFSKCNQPISIGIYEDMLQLLDNETQIAKPFIDLKHSLIEYELKNYDYKELKKIEELADEVMRLPIFHTTMAKKNNLTEQEIINISCDFYRRLNNEYYQKILKIVNRRNSIHMDYNNSKAPMGSCFSVNALEKVYIYINRNKTLYDVFVTNHELIHGNNFYSSYNTEYITEENWTTLDDIFDELPSSLIEFLTADYLIREGFDKQQIIDLRTNDYNEIYSIFDDFTTKFKILEFLKHNKKHIEDISSNDISINLRKQGIIVTNPSDYLEQDLMSNIRYGVSYLISNYIYNNYNKKEMIDIINDTSSPYANIYQQLQNHNVNLNSKVLIKELKEYTRTLS